jgi:RNA polymerase sigma factor (sigma-70 family)
MVGVDLPTAGTILRHSRVAYARQRRKTQQPPSRPSSTCADIFRFRGYPLRSPERSSSVAGIQNDNTADVMMPRPSAIQELNAPKGCTKLHRWFTTQVLPHEPDLTRYLRNRWLDRSEVADLRQEVYARVYQSARRTPPAHVRALLFATARNLMADRVRRRQVVAIQYRHNVDSHDALVDERSPEHCLSARQELNRIRRALARLSGNSGRAIWLCRIEGLPQKEVAARLGIPEGTLESQVSRGMRLLSAILSGTNTSTLQPKATARRPAPRVARTQQQAHE